VQPPTVTKMIARMGSEGLVRRQASPTDGRKVFVHLTEDGQNCARKLKSLWKTLDQDAARGLGAKDRKQLTDLLQSMAAAWMPDPVDASGKPEKPTKPKKNAKAKKAKKAKA
jgi:DNA-binding MarR family transcriptional regulator